MKLYVVGLPIGNIEDISMRAIKILQSAELIVCEDTRMFSNLWTKLTSLGMATKQNGKLRFVNDFNEYRVLPKIIAEAASMETVALVSDAGMPLISDPGYKLVRSGIDLGWDIEVVPGPTAESAALAISGLPTDKYLFVGFCPKKPGKRQKLLEEIKEMKTKSPMTIIFYESPQRTIKLLEEIKTLWGDEVHVCVANDLTKISQKIWRGSLPVICEEMKDKTLKGEVAIVLN